MKKVFQTDLRCGTCVQTIAPILNSDGRIHSWSADVSKPEKTLIVEGEDVSSAHVGALLERAGYRILRELPAETTRQPGAVAVEEQKESYFPLLLLLLYLFGLTGVSEWASGSPDPQRAMSSLMASFFIVFSFFKLLDLRAFADAFGTYDLIAKRSRRYALFYPFLELGLGVAYLTRFMPVATNLIAAILMTVGTAGVVKSLLEKRPIRCACLGTVFNVPMTFLTLVEDALMAGMAAFMLIAHS